MLEQINPVAKLIANLIAITACVIVFDPYTPLMLLGIALLAGFFTRTLRVKHTAAFIPFVLFALGMVWMNAAWADVPGAKPIWYLGPLVFTDQGLMVGLSLGIRVLAIAAFSILFMAATDPTDLMLGFVQHCRMPPAIAYSIMAALRFLPTMQNELMIIRAAHRIRGNGEKGWRNSINRGYRYAIPLLAGGIRRAERVALAMEARGFSKTGKRTYYRNISWRRRDSLYILGTLTVIAGILAISAVNGWLITFTQWIGF